MDLQTSRVTIAVRDGSSMQCYISAPKDNTPHPALIVFQEAFGITSHMRSVCDRLAAEGYVTIAPEMFHRTAEAGAEFAYSDFDSIRPHFAAITPEAIAADIHAAYDHLLKMPNVSSKKIGSIGFCFGGRVSFIANAELPLAVAVSYYGGGMQQVIDRAKDLHAPQLLFWGGLDKHIPHETVEQVTAALRQEGKTFTNVEISYADHAFNCDDRPSYHPQAAREAWAMTLAFLKNNLS